MARISPIELSATTPSQSQGSNQRRPFCNGHKVASPHEPTSDSKTTRPGRIRKLQPYTLALFTLAFILVTSACSSSATVERSFQDDLELHLGRELSPNEVVEYKDAADLLCSSDEAILEQLWDELDEDQFHFQTFVFTEECPERQALYREAAVTQRTTSTPPTTASSATTDSVATDSVATDSATTDSAATTPTG